MEHKRRSSLEFSRREALRLAILGGIGAAGLLGCTTDRNTGSSKSEATRNESRGEFSDTPAFSQNFDQLPDGSIDNEVWRYDLNPDVPGYNNEAQGYTDSKHNVRIEKGALVIEAHRERYEYPNDPEHRSFDITSGRIDTRDSFTFEYGKLEVTAKLPNESGTWPAFWLLSANQPHTTRLNPENSDAVWEQDRFYLHDGELDIMEAYGSTPNSVEATVHTYNTREKPRTSHASVPDVSGEFHTYGVELTPEGVTWTIDGKPYYSLKKPDGSDTDDWPFGHGNQLYLIMNLAMGGEASGELEPSDESWRMTVKNVKFYEIA